MNNSLSSLFWKKTFDDVFNENLYKNFAIFVTKFSFINTVPSPEILFIVLIPNSLQAIFP